MWTPWDQTHLLTLSEWSYINNKCSLKAESTVYYNTYNIFIYLRGQLTLCSYWLRQSD